MFSKLQRDFVAVLENNYNYECAEELWDGFVPKIRRQSALESKNSPGIKTLLDNQAIELDGIFGEGRMCFFNLHADVYAHCCRLSP